MKTKSFTSQQVGEWLASFYQFNTKDEYQNKLQAVRCMFDAEGDPDFWEEACKAAKAKLEASEREQKVVALDPMMKQFHDLKEKHPDALLLFRRGDFYESYEDDAEKCAKTLGITLTMSNKDRKKMAGFPCHAIDTYLPKLVRAGYRIAICDQMEAPKATVKRGITELVTPAVVNQ